MDIDINTLNIKVYIIYTRVDFISLIIAYSITRVSKTLTRVKHASKKVHNNLYNLFKNTRDYS